MTRTPPAPDTQPHRLKHYRHRWDEVGISTFPLNENEKTPICNDWQTRLPEEMWQEAVQRPDTANTQHNIGVRAGQLTTSPDTSLAIIDMDNATSRRNIEARLTALGLETANVRTASRSGRHAYLLTSGVPETFNYKRLNKDIGAGELRAGRGSYVVAPCSEVDGNCYIFTQGNIESLMTQQVVSWRELQWLLPDTIQAQPHTSSDATLRIDELPLTLQHRTMPTYTHSLLEWCVTAQKGTGISKYPTRSEAEAAVVTQLIGCGWKLSEVIRVFQKRQPAHYAEKGAAANRYLASTYGNVLAWMCNTPIRHSLVDLYHAAPPVFKARAYRTNLTELAVFQALVAHCWRHNTLAVHASGRDLAEQAASTHPTVAKTLHTLQDLGCVVLLKKADKTKRIGTKWGLVGLPDNNEMSITYHKSQKAKVSSKQVSVNSVSSEADKVLASKFSGLWSVRGGLKRSSGAVWHCLSDEPQTIPQLIVATGKVRSTVRGALAELQQYGAASEVAEGHIRGAASLTELAHVIGAEGLTSRRRNRHTWERKAYDRWMQTKDTVAGSKG